MKISSMDSLEVPEIVLDQDINNLSHKVTQLLSAVFYASNDAMLLLDQEATILIVNPNAEKLFQTDDAKIRGTSFDNFIPEQNRQRFLSLLQHFALTSSAGNTKLDKMEIAAMKPNGKMFPMEISLSIINIDEEIFFIATVNDIADKKRTEVEIKMLAHAMRSINEGLAIVDLKGNVIFTNEIMYQIFGYKNNEFKSNNFTRFFCKSDAKRFEDEVIPVTLKNRWEGEMTAIKNDGQEFPFYFSTSAIGDDSGNPILIICVGRDISERKYLEDQLRHAQKMEAIGQLAGGVAHDFNNLLIVISGYSNNLLKNIRKDDSNYKNILQISKAADRAASLTRQLLAFSRKQILQPKLLDLNNLINDTEKMLKRLIGENINLSTVLSSDTRKIQADPGQIEQVIMNLVVNARDAMPDGGNLEIKTENIIIREKEEGEYNKITPGEFVQLKISDTGVGMSEKTKERIFEPFFTTKEKGKGTGLGLSTVYGIIEQSGFHILVSSTKNVGTSFSILIPVAAQPEIGTGEIEIKSKPNDIFGTETLLVVEDEEQVRELVIEMLETHGYKVLQATNGKEAIKVYNQQRDSINLILTDVVMPEMGGKKLIQSLTNFKEGTKVLYMSGYTDNAIDEQGILEPGTQFIQKPFSPLDLLKKIREILQSN